MTAIGWIADIEGMQEAEDWAARLTLEQLTEVLTGAYELGVEFRPLLAGGRRWTPDTPTEQVPLRFAIAQKMHARDIARATYLGEAGQVGPDGFSITVFPMDFKIRNLYRPKRAGRGGPR